MIAIAIPHQMGAAINDLLGPNPGDSVRPRVVLIIVLAVLQACMRVPGSLLIVAVARNTESDVRARLFAHLMRQDRSFYRAHSTGDLASRFTSDMTAVGMMWSGGVVWVCGAGMLVLAAVVAMFSIDATLAVWALAPMPAGLFVASLLGRAVKQRTTETQRQLGMLSSAVQEDLAGIAVIRNYRLEAQRREHVAASSTSLISARMRAQSAEGAFPPLLSACTAASMLAVLWVGGSAVIDGRMNVGELVQFSAYLSLVVVRIIGLGDIVSTFQRGAASWARIAAVLAIEPAIVDGGGPGFASAVRGDIEIRDLTIERDGQRILDRVSLRIAPGTVCAVVGRVGSGKSTLVEAIPRMIDVPAGTVFVDGRDVTDLPLAALRGAVAYAAQNPFLLSATIAENIAVGLTETDDDRARVERAARAAGLASDLAALPAGLDTQVGERGVTVSGGQRQRIALSRALASDRPIVVLDDSLSAVDTTTERQILDHLDRELAGRSLILVSHRIAAVRRAHQIVVLEAGRVVEVGRHDELLARDGFYAALYRDQLAEEAS